MTGDSEKYPYRKDDVTFETDKIENEEEIEEELELVPQRLPHGRTALIVFTILLLWLVLSMRNSLSIFRKRQQVIYASRYSKEHKFRPAASPIITTTLKDGRVRIHGAVPTASPLSEVTGKKKIRAAKRRSRNTKAKKSEKGL